MEMLTVILIMGIIGLTTSVVIMESMKVYARTVPGLDASYQARLATDRMKREIRDLDGTASITVFTATALTFDNTSGDTIAYDLTGSDLTRNGDLLAQGVTSSTCPSEKWASTIICCVAFCLRMLLFGKTSSRVIRGSSSRGPGCPAAIQSERTRYSCESTSNRTPPLCGIAPVGLVNSKLRPGSEGTTRRPRDWRVMVRKSAWGL